MLDVRNDTFTIEDRSQLIYALTEAAALEHVLMCQYLFAAASLKTDVSELAVSNRRYYQIERIRYWKRKLTEVAREEMQHLAMAMNLLVAVGGAPTFVRPNFPNENLYYKNRLPDGSTAGLLMSLEKFSGREGAPFTVIDRFVRFESPDKPFRTQLLEFVPPANTYDTVGRLYRAIQQAFGTIPNVIIDQADQYEPTDEAGDNIRLIGRPPFALTVTTPAEAQAMIEQIIDQGEGYPEKKVDPRSHYEIFKLIRKEFEEELSLDPSFQPARNLAPNPMTRRHDGIDANLVTIIEERVDGGLQHNLLQLFAGCYEVLISWLGQLFSGSARQPKSPTLRAMESLTFLPFMSEVISPLAELLTQVPIQFGDHSFLGPGFEVTSNDFLLPSLEVSAKLTNERLSELARLSGVLVDLLRSHGAKEASRQLAFVSKTLSLMKDEFDSRATFGWIPPVASWDPKYSEAVPQNFKYEFKDQAVLELHFEGVVQCRLATDPDGANVARGVTGNGFAIGDEPDLDRVIYFQASGASQRSHCPEIGVKVRTARLVRRSTDPWREKGELVPELTDALIDLIGGPKFEGRNHVVSEDGEPIDPFTVEIRTTTGLVIGRGTIGIPINDMTPLQRRGSGRYPAGAKVSAEAAAANLAILSRLKHPFNFSNPLEYTLDRISNLQKDFEAVKAAGKEFTKEAAELQFRLRGLDEGLRAPMELDARTIRWTRYFFDCGYRHFVSGDFGETNLGPLAGRFDLVTKSTQPDSSRWLVEYHLGFFDTDAMCACISGNLFVPVKAKTN